MARGPTEATDRHQRNASPLVSKPACADTARNLRLLFRRVPMPFRVLYLARHGETQANSIGQINGSGVEDHLSRLGYEQRLVLFQALRNVPLAAIYVSELARTRETASPLAAELGLRLTIRPELNEFRGGIFEGLCKDLFSPKSVTSRCRPDPTPPEVAWALAHLRGELTKARAHPLTYRAPGGGESVADVLCRLRRFLASVPTFLRDRQVLVVGHGGTNRFLLGLLLGLAPLQAKRIRQGHTQIFRLTAREPQPPLLEQWTPKGWVGCSVASAPQSHSSPAITCRTPSQ